MGSSVSRPPPLPFPMPDYGVDRPGMASKLGKWTLGSMAKKSKKGKDRAKVDDFIFPKHPTPSAAHIMSYYPQMPPVFPGYLAPVQMAMVQPMPGQQPVLAMPQGYLPMMTYQTTAAPVQPPVVRPITAPVSASVPPVHMSFMSQPPTTPSQMPQPQPVSSTHVPQPTAPSQMPQPQPVSSTQMPQPQPVPGSTHIPQSRTPSVPTQMPQSHHVHYPHTYQGPVIPYPSSPIPAEPVIPPPPIVGSEPRQAPDSVRTRFTDFYRSPDFLPPRRASVEEPVRPPTAGPAGRTPFAPPLSMPAPTPAPALRMPTPAAIPTSNNPLPRPPADIWDTLPYRQVLENLPTDVSTLLDLGQRSEVIIGAPDEPVQRPPSRIGSLFRSSSRKDKGKAPVGGLFRSRSTSGHDVLRDVLSDLGPISGSRPGHSRAQTMTAIVIPPLGSGTGTMDMPISTQGPPIKFDHTGEYAGFVNHSSHRVMYKNKMYPTALHLLEAMKFTHQPSLQERIRTCKDVNDMYPLSASLQEQVRSDWGQVFLKTMEDVLYLKFKQHPNLRALLLGTGMANIIYMDDSEYWGEGVTGEGTNELGRALVRVRERLRQEGER